MPAIILEAKNSGIDISKQDCTAEIIKNIDIVMTKYKVVIGILYNGYFIRVFKNHDEITKQISSKLENKKYYIKYCTDTGLDIKSIKDITMRINNNLHFKFGMQNL
ncbi:MAG: hypothetical protein IJ859_04705, partial [Synergistaceae bacterium]|nr:hypothetical protein [Synergistaceae bacterium]